MTRPTALVADDEPNLREYLCDRLADAWPELEIVACVGTGREALAEIASKTPDIAFLDIRMPGMTGLDVARELNGPTRVVFVTAYDQYAVEAFDNAAVDYLLKPIDPNRLAKTVARLQMATDSDSGLAQVRAVIAQLTDDRPRYLHWIKVGQAGETRVVPTDEIVFFRAEHKYTTVRTPSAELLVRKSIKDLETELDPEQFWRIHRSTLVNVRYIDVARRDFRGRFSLHLKAVPDVLKVSDTYAHLFRQM